MSNKKRQLIDLTENELTLVAGGFGPPYAGGTFSPDTLSTKRLFSRDHMFGSLDYGFGFEMPIEFTIEPNGVAYH